jgi:hypothetical protein
VGVGVVYRAWHPPPRHSVAVKWPVTGRHAGPVEPARFLREQRGASRSKGSGVLCCDPQNHCRIMML